MIGVGSACDNCGASKAADDEILCPRCKPQGPRTVARQLLERKARLLFFACEQLHTAAAERVANATRILAHLEGGKPIGECPGAKGHDELAAIAERMAARVEVLMEAAYEEERIARIAGR